MPNICISFICNVLTINCEFTLLGVCTRNDDCHEKRACVAGKCVYPCDKETCNDALQEKCLVYNHKAECRGKF